MGLDMSSFGGAVASARKDKGMSQKELAAKIVKEDGQPITPQYLNDIEHDRRSPSSDHMIRQFIKVLEIKEEGVLYGLSGVLPEQDQKLVRRATPEKVDAAYVAFRKALKE
ncbi:transcriptional regulator, XRE family [Enhydrobacter aerosaccus]|uniref:Transcriptional regulator, XRE family n=2 Tax=Enhydrobacter aerosaccus TaxID=225324 RepID=A0A1T4TLM5_9HYPH|nr:transcriptional regulator, XRE family [Enhydrobacter aerosaccus]